MSIEIDIQTADAAWPAARPLLEAIWPADAVDPIQRAKPDFRILVESLSDGVVTHAGIFRRDGIWKGRKVRIGGVGSVATYADHRRRGYAGLALRAAVQTFRDEEVIDFGLTQRVDVGDASRFASLLRAWIWPTRLRAPSRPQ